MKNFRIEFRWALIISFFSIIWFYFEKALGLHGELIGQHAMYTNLIVIPQFLLYYFALKQKRDIDYQGHITWQQATLSGGILSVLIAVISPLVQYIFDEYISPEFFTNAIDQAVQNGRMNREGAESLFNLEFYIIQAVFGSLAFGVVISALVALIVKRKPDKNQ